MQCLFINLASHHGLLALVTENAVIASDHVDQRLGDHELVPRLEALLKVAGCAFPDLTHIACVIGPGGFMSLRVGVAFANILADQLGIPSCGIHLSDLCYARWEEGQEGNKAKGQDVLWMHSTKKQALFVRGFGDCAKTWPVPTHVTLEKFVETLRRDVPLARLPWVGELILEHRTAIASAAEVHEPPLLPLEEILPAFLHRQEFKKQILEPWYGRGW